MTDPSSTSWRRRRRGGKYRGPVRDSADSTLSPDAARENRDAAFGTRPKNWIGTPATASAAEEGSAPQEPSAPAQRAPQQRNESEAEPPTEHLHPADEPPADEPPAPPAAGEPLAGGGEDALTPRRHGRRASRPLPAEDEEADAWSASSPSVPASAAAASSAASPSAPASSAAAPRSDRGASPLGAPEGSPERRTSAPQGGGRDSEDRDRVTEDREPTGARSTRRRGSGSLPLVAFWTVLTSVLPGSGLVTTHLRRLGWFLLALLIIGGAGAGAWVLLGDPVRQGAMLLSSRRVLIGLTAAVALVGVVWAIQIVLANLAHSTKERLAGAKRWIALAVCALMVVAVALPFGRGVQSLWAFQGLLGSETVFGQGTEQGRLKEGKDPWAGVGRLNIMLLGQDAGADRTGTRPDTIMVASIDTESGRTALFSIPRNLEHVRFPAGTAAAEEFPDGFRYYGQNQDLINAVWSWAEDRPDLFPGDEEPGLTATTWAVEETLGLEMDYYAMVNLQGFEDLVNAIGGVDLVVERRIPIGGGAAKIDGYIEPGQQKLDGFHALWYARSREGSDDFNRMCRQQRIVRAVAEEADPTTLAMSVPGLVTATEENIQTDIPVRRLDAFVDLALRIKDAGFTSYPITQDVTPSGNADWEYLKSWTQASIEDSMKQAKPESVKGETEPGSTDPAPTGEAPPQDGTGEGEQPPAEEAPAEDPVTDQESSDPNGEGGAEQPPAEAPQIEQDPLKSCLPGAEQGG